MSVFKSLLDKLQAKKEEVQRDAAKKAAEIAIEKSKNAAKSAVMNAGKTLEKALFGEAEQEPTPEEVQAAKTKAAGDKLRAAADRQKAREQAEEEAAARREAAAKLENDVDDELAALKKKLKK